MFKQGALRQSCATRGEWRWANSDGEGMGSVNYYAVLCADTGTLTLDYTHQDRGGVGKTVACRIELETVACHYGGLKWYMRCPYTCRRALKLYKWPGIDLFCHRNAIKPLPTYASQRVSGSDRIMAQRWALRRKLGDSVSDLTMDPIKPKWMRWRTFWRFLDRDADLAAREWSYFVRLLGNLGVETGG